MPAPRILYDLHSIPFTATGGGILEFATVADLAAYDDTVLDDGAIAFVRSIRSYWSRVVQTDPGTDDGITNVQDPTNVATWYRLSLASPSWLNTANWYIANVTGSDEGTGSITDPLKTHDEFMRRIGDNSLNQDLNVTFTETFAGNISHVMAPNQQSGYAVNYTAALDTTTAPLLTGSFTAFSAISRAVNGRRTDFDSTESLATWEALIGKLIVVTSGAAIGSYAWVTGATEADDVTVYTTPFIQATSTNVDPTVVDPANLDTFAVIDLLGLTCDNFYVSTMEATPFPADISPVTFSNLSFGLTKESTISGASNVTFFTCEYDSLAILNAADIRNYGVHLLSAVVIGGDANYDFDAGFIDGVANGGAILVDSNSARATIGSDTVTSGPGARIEVAANAQISISDLGFFDCDNPGIVLYHHANASISGYVYGSGNTNFIFQLSTLSSVVDNVADLIADTSSSNVSFGDAIVKDWADLPFIANALVTDSQASWVNGI